MLAGMKVEVDTSMMGVNEHTPQYTTYHCIFCETSTNSDACRGHVEVEVGLRSKRRFVPRARSHRKKIRDATVAVAVVVAVAEDQ
jgi:hypothetical protein